MNKDSFVKYFFIYGLISILIVLLDILFPLTFIKETGVRLILPLSFATQSTVSSLNSFFDEFIHTKQIFREYSRLKEENSDLKAQIIRLQGVEQENELLRESLDVGQNRDISKVIARVIGREENNLFGYIIINIGSADQIAPGMPVIVGERLLGRVDEVYNNTSRVELLSSSTSSIPVKIWNDSTNKTISILEGGFGLKLKLTKIDQDAVINKGDLVITSGEGGTYPANLLVGTVSEVEKKVETMLYQEAKVDSLVDASLIEEVIVLKQTHY